MWHVRQVRLVAEKDLVGRLQEDLSRAKRQLVGQGTAVVPSPAAVALKVRTHLAALLATHTEACRVAWQVHCIAR